MIEIRTSTAKTPNPEIREQPRKDGESNSQWLARALGGADPAGTVVLIGGAALTDFRLRVAQSHARRDLLPSFWSHAGLIAKAAGRNDWKLFEVGLEPPRGFGPVPLRNGVQHGSLRNYDDPKRYPNMACFQVTVAPGALAEGGTLAGALDRAIDSFQKQRSLVDLGGYVVEWLAFIWGVGSSGNPLLKGTGVPSAVFLESIFAMAGIELTPSVASNSSCPEAIWQAAKWWHEFYSSEATLTESAPRGAFVVDQPAAAAIFEAESGAPSVRNRKRPEQRKRVGGKRRR